MAWRIVANTRRAVSALEDALRVLPSLVASLPPPPERRALPTITVPVRVGERINTVFIGAICGMVGLPLLAALLVNTASPLPDNKIGALFGAHFLLLPFPLLLSVGFSREVASFDAGDLALVRRIFGVAVERTVIPTEIIDAFVVDPARFEHLYVEVGAERLSLSDGNQVREAARVLNEALGLPRKKKKKTRVGRRGVKTS